MQSQEKRDRLAVKNQWLLCPVCKRGKVLKLNPGTRAVELTVYCKVCGSESIVNIDECLCQSACAT